MDPRCKIIAIVLSGKHVHYFVSDPRVLTRYGQTDWVLFAVQGESGYKNGAVWAIVGHSANDGCFWGGCLRQKVRSMDAAMEAVILSMRACIPLSWSSRNVFVFSPGSCFSACSLFSDTEYHHRVLRIHRVRASMSIQGAESIGLGRALG